MRVPFAHLCAVLMAGQQGEEGLQFPLSRCGGGAMKLHSKAWDRAEFVFHDEQPLLTAHQRPRSVGSREQGRHPSG